MDYNNNNNNNESNTRGQKSIENIIRFKISPKDGADAWREILTVLFLWPVLVEFC